MATVAFWAAAVLLAQTYFLYPLWLVLLSPSQASVAEGSAADDVLARRLARRRRP
jgi:hypothetical protein